VYEAEHELLGVRRALKVLSRQLADREDMAERLRLEARALAQLKHPHLVEVNDLGVSSDGRVFFAMELLTGATLRDVLRQRGTLRHAAAIDLACQILDALHAAHERGMVHRDVKPENIWVSDNGTAKLLDFGVAKAVGGRDGHALTQQGTTVGTPRYMAPEQAESSAVDRRVDVFAMGLVLWECLVGRTPFADLDAMAAMVAAVTRGIPSVGASLSGPVVPRLIVCVDRATARQPADRFPTAAALRDELLAIRPLVQDAGEAPTAEHPTLASMGAPSAFAPTENAMTLPGSPPPGAVTSHDVAASTMPLVPSVRPTPVDTTARLAAGARVSSPSYPPAALDRRSSPTPTGVSVAPVSVFRTQPLPAGTGGNSPPSSGSFTGVASSPPPHAPPVAPARAPRALLLLPAGIVVVGLAAVGAVALDRAIGARGARTAAVGGPNAGETTRADSPAASRDTPSTSVPSNAEPPAGNEGASGEGTPAGSTAPTPTATSLGGDNDATGKGKNGKTTAGAGGATGKSGPAKGGPLPKSGL
jgi:serine/threonine-protein kinase